MDQEPQVDPTPAPKPPRRKIAVVFGEMGRVNLNALKYLIVHLNTVQNVFEYDILPAPRGHRLLSLLNGWGPTTKKDVLGQLDSFHAALTIHVAEAERDHVYPSPVHSTVPGQVVLMTMGKLDNWYVSTGNNQVRVVALGDWQRGPAPPSILEFQGLRTMIRRNSLEDL